MNEKTWYRRIPKTDVLLADERIQNMIKKQGKAVVMDAIHMELAEFRRLVKEKKEETLLEQRLEFLNDHIEKRVMEAKRADMCPVINGTGTILHTNLGRAPLSKKHMEHILTIASGYSNLEYNLEQGKRGERYAHFESLLCKLTGAEAAMAVNNNAASVLLILSTLAFKGEVITSRGELVEIGGHFRIPDVMEQGGAVLREVGTTNKTRLDDFERAINEQTRGILKVHTSNYRIVGFTESVSLEELVSLGEKYGLPVIEDLGSGVFINLEKYGLSHEPTVQESVRAGADVVCFSGDKLLGGPQAGIIVGKKKYIEQMKKNPLTRAIRIDKFTAAALEQVLLEYLSEEQALKNIPVLRMITTPREKVEKKAADLQEMLYSCELAADFKIVSCDSQIGGGALPLERIPSVAVAIFPHFISADQLETRMRALPVPVIPRIADDRVLLDMRTIEEGSFSVIASQFKQLRVLEAQQKTEEKTAGADI